MADSSDIAARVRLLNKSAERRRAAIHLSEGLARGMTMAETAQAIQLLCDLHQQIEADLGSFLTLEIERLSQTTDSKP